MAYSKEGNLRLRNNKKIIFDQGGEVYSDGTDIIASTTVSGVTPTEDYHLTTKDYVDGEIVTFSGTIDHDTILNTHNLTTDIDHDQLTNFSADEHFTEASIDHTNIQNVGSTTHSGIDVHIADADKHRIINDSGSGATDLWSAEKIEDRVVTATGTLIQDHSELNELDYASANHTGFASSSDLTTLSGNLQTNIDGKLANIVEDTTPQLGGDVDLNGHNIYHTSILTSSGTYQGTIMTVTVDDASAVFGNALYCASDFHYERADADAAPTMPCSVLALESGSGSKKVLLEGQICNTDWDWSAGVMYVSCTTGDLTQTTVSGTGDQVQIVGHVLSADTIYFHTNLGMAEVE